MNATAPPTQRSFPEESFEMVKVSGPMMSMDASGKLGDAVVFSKWKGRNYVRQLVKPANPKSGLQTGMRAMFGFLAQRWAILSAPNKASWDALAAQIVASPFNAYMRQNQRFWRDFTAPSQSSTHLQSDAVGITPTNTATGGVRSITLSMELATINQNWGIIIFKSDTTAFTPSLSNAVKVVPLSAAATPVLWVDSPLAAGTWFYNFMAISTEGVLGAAMGEESAMAT